jgi:hypothetical protein
MIYLRTFNVPINPPKMVQGGSGGFKNDTIWLFNIAMENPL